MEAGGAEGSQEQGMVVGGRGRIFKMGRRRIRDLETKVGQECSISRGGQIVQWRYMCPRSPGRESQCYGRGAAPRVRAAKSSEFGEEKL